MTGGASERLRVALDATPLIGVRTGIGRIVDGLLAALAPDSSLDLRAYAITWRGRSDLAASLPAGVAAATRPFPARLARAAWLRFDTPRLETWTGPLDVAHATNYVAPPSRAPTLVSIYDLTFLHHPELCTPDVRQYPTLIGRALARGAWIHTTSEFVRAEVIDAFSIPPERGSARSRAATRRQVVRSPAHRAMCSRSARSSPARTFPSSLQRSTAPPTTIGSSRS